MECTKPLRQRSISMCDTIVQLLGGRTLIRVDARYTRSLARLKSALIMAGLFRAAFSMDIELCCALDIRLQQVVAVAHRGAVVRAL